MITRSNRCDVFQFSDESWVTLVDLVANAKLSILVVAHSIDLPFCSQNKGVEDTTLNLLGLVGKIDEDGS